MKTFSLQEARGMLPVLEGMLRGTMEAKQLIEEIEAELQDLTQTIFLNGGTLVDVRHVARRKAEKEKAMQRAKDAVAEMNAIGVQVKDLDIGLLDFPCKVGEEVVLLCWKLGESSITHWHGLEEGFAGRKPIDERIARAESDNVQ
jgi:hypothetical protein